ncbi:hypothetical protein [Patulibacter minatonensis]|uniref:hypothetical protein n=1 Tax=Patulibacter minatonensis TaxID=298163 RepID=UPI00047BC1CC|nr:hypothetical protein [Patulibacter minatonensis]
MSSLRRHRRSAPRVLRVRVASPVASGRASSRGRSTAGLRLALVTFLLAAVPTAGLAVAAAPASAAKGMVTTMADDGVLNGAHGDPAPIVARWKAAGVQNVRMFAQWSHIAPDPEATKPPAGFDGKAEGAYSFADLDRKIDLIRQNGMTVTLVVTGPGPVWGSLEPARRNPRWRPSPTMFGDFATAVAKHVKDRVDDYIVWNEPNVATWLQPQNMCTGSKCRVYSPHLYRKLAAAGYDAIHGADPGSTIAIGATSSKGDRFVRRMNGTTQPMVFLRELACVDSKYRRRSTGDCRGFVAPKGNVLAYHPHSSKYSPGYTSPSSGDARMGDLSRLTTVVDRLTKAKRLKVVGASRFPLWLDEYAYETNPPDTTLGISPAAQAAWSQWGWWTAWRNSRVQMLAQYEWMDEGSENTDDDPKGWQSGLYFDDGRAKPLAQVFPNPIFGYRTTKSATVWGQVRTATGATKVTLQRASGGSWRDYATVTTDAHGAFTRTVPRSTTAKYRYTYVSPVDGTTRTSGSTALRKR